MTELVSKAFVVTGRVQGVGFRWWTQREAERLSIGGTAQNVGNGSVEVHIIGSPGRVEAMTDRLREGPPMAKVERMVEVEPDENLIPGVFRIVG
jgi:acylphosphatase